ncbi:hypothetical protein E4U43_002590, partial [Claviceps pusilla]
MAGLPCYEPDWLSLGELVKRDVMKSCSGNPTSGHVPETRPLDHYSLSMGTRFVVHEILFQDPAVHPVLRSSFRSSFSGSFAKLEWLAEEETPLPDETQVSNRRVGACPVTHVLRSSATWQFPRMRARFMQPRGLKRIRKLQGGGVKYKRKGKLPVVLGDRLVDFTPYTRSRKNNVTEFLQANFL